jgi:ParB family chromosome partitioning protein
MGDAVTGPDARRPVGGLGRGIAALIPTSEPEGRVREIPLRSIDANPHQPRASFSDDALASLVESILVHGLLQPVLVVEVGDRYRIVAGERRVRAARLAGLERVPCIVRSADEQEQLAMALVENIQRADLNPMDEARAFRRLIDEFGLTQDQVARQVGRSRPAVTNTLRLLDLDADVQAAVSAGRITEGHARAIAGLASVDAQRQVLATIVARSLSVRQAEAIVQGWRDEPSRPRPRTRLEDPDLQQLEARMREALGTKVSLSPGRRGGRITISWFDHDDLARIVDRLIGEDRPMREQP